MIYPEHARPGDLLPPLALDVARTLLPRLDLDLPDLPADAVHQTLKEALEWGKMPRFHEECWECLQSYAKATLPKPAQDQLLDWFWRGYSGYHAANPDLSDWIDVLMMLAFIPQQSYEMQLTPVQRDQLDEFLATFAAEVDMDNLADLFDELRSLPPSPWDRKLLMRYEMVYFDRQTGSDPFLIIKQANKAQAFRRTMRLKPPSVAAGFPLEILNAYAVNYVQERGTWYPPGVTMCGLTEVE
ncbi:hypothetical protein [Yoonia sp. 2307UL14-13]|uniref:hypothetical protein n=1 Tax=Yoonia sp. 2307UL14-13 TaxID=3126506 RepID=UPI0030B5A14D